MCGINFILDKKGLLSDSSIQQMNNATVHRGPEASTYEVIKKNNAHYFFGNNRLRIIDTRHIADQPMYTANKDAVLTFNGAVYNYLSLRTQLSKLYPLKTESDTEVLLYHLYHNHIKGLNQLQGMYSFVFYNDKKTEVLVGRDTHGMKPLYYYNDDNYLIVSSEIKGIIASGLVKKEFNEQQLSHYLNYNYCKKPFTFYKGIYELQEGNYISYASNTFSIKKYYQPAAKTFDNYSQHVLMYKTDKLFTQAVNKHLIADVPCGLYLSGGIDSTLLLAKIRDLGYKNFPTFTICNHNKDSSYGTLDAYYAREAAKKYKSDHHEIYIDHTILKDLDAFIAKVDQPIADNSMLITYLLAQKSNQHIKVALTGAGADEYFAGYNRHQAYYKYLKYIHPRPYLINFIKKFDFHLSENSEHRFRKKFRLLNKLVGSMDINPMHTFHNYLTSPYFRNKDEQFNTPSENSIQYLLLWALRHDQSNYLTQDVLKLTDNMSMLASVETRMPYLDNELIQFTQTINPNQLLSKGSKWILKELLKQHDGGAFINRDKEGFGFPFGKWIKEADYLPMFYEVLEAKHPLYQWLNYEQILEIVMSHIKQRRDCSREVWALLLLFKWYNIHFK